MRMIPFSLLVQPLVQYSSATGNVAANVRIRYNAREGNDLYLVYNDGLNTERSFTDPRPLLSSHRMLLVKHAHTFGR